MTKPSPFVVDHDETYCLFSLRIIHLVKALIVVTFCGMFVTELLLATPQRWWQSKQFYECPSTDPEPYSFQLYRHFVRFTPEAFRCVVVNFIFLLQIAEWFSMITIIKNQRGKMVGQILFEYNFENMEEELKWRDKKQLNFRKKEAILKRGLKSIAMVWSTVLIAQRLFYITSPLGAFNLYYII